MTRSAERTAAEIAAHVGGTLEGPPDAVIRAVAGIEEAGPGELTFLAHPRYRPALQATRASAILAPPGVPCPPGLAVVRVADPYRALQRVLEWFDPGPPRVPPGVHPSARPLWACPWSARSAPARSIASASRPLPRKG